jgi:phage minor structural protein
LIHIADHQTDIILDDITEDAFWQDSHKKSLVNMKETFDFITFADKSFSEFLSKRNRIIIPDEDGQYIEFVITNTRKYRTNGALKCDVYTSAHYVTLQTAKVIQPHVTGADSAETHAINALAGTEYEVGTVAFKGVRTITFEEHTNPYKYLKKIASEFGLELHFRVESEGTKIIKRYVDLVERVGTWQGREVELGKDLEGIERKEDFSNIVTALVGLGPIREDGTRLEVVVENQEALERWGRNGQHIIATYEPQSTDLDMTEARLIQLTENELEKRINSVVQYKADIIDLEKVIGLEHEKIRFGDTIKIKDIKFNPPLYLEARVHTQDRSIKRKGKKTVELGDYIEYTEEQVNAIWKTLQQQIANKISMSQLTEATYTKTQIDTKDNVVQSNAATDASNKAQQAETNAKEHADTVATDAETNAKQHANQLKSQIDAELLEKAGLEYVNGQLVLKADQSQVDTIESELNGAILDIADKADLSYVDGQLVLKANQSQVDGLVQDIADKADLTYVNGQLTSKADKADTYTITQVDNALNSKVSTTQYTTDINGIVTDLNDHESRITQTETDITSKVSSTQYNQDISAIQGDISTLETTVGNHTTSINQNASAISLKANATDVYTKTQVDTSLNNKADATTVNAIETRVSEAEAELIVQAGQIASKVSQTEYDADINGVVTRLDSAESSITQNANEISQRVTTTTYNAGMASKEDTVYKQSSAPAHANGRLWLNTSVTPNILYRSTGSAWVKATPTTASEVGAYSSSAGNSLANRVTTAESNITQNANAITLKASQSALENLEDDVTSVTNQVGSLQVSVNGITADVSSLESTVNGHTTDISSLNSQLTVQAGQIASKVDATYVTGAISDIEIGGRNLFSIEDFSVNRYTNENINLPSWKYQGIPNTEYTVSTNMPRNSGNGFDLFFDPYPSSPSSARNGVAIGEPRTIISDSTGLIEITTRDNLINNIINGVYEIKLEKGNKATDWTPAPEDVQAEIDSVYSYASSEINQLAGQISLKADSSTVNSINTRLSSAEIDINALEGAITSKVESSTFNALEGRVDSAESTITQHSNQINLKVDKNGVISSINQTAEAIKIQASKLNLVGAVTVLSSITGNLGTITAGIINGVTINGATINSILNTKNKTTIANNRIYSEGEFWKTGFGSGNGTVNGYGIFEVNSGVISLKSGLINSNGTRQPWQGMEFSNTGAVFRGENNGTGSDDLHLSIGGIGWGNHWDSTAVSIYRSVNNLVLNASNRVVVNDMSVDRIYSKYNSAYSMMTDHNNGNVSVNAAGGSLYLGYDNTSLVYFNRHARIQSDATYTRLHYANDCQMRMTATDGQIAFYQKGAYRHLFNANGTKSGGSIEIDNEVLGMSPIDSPRVLISDMILNVEIKAGQPQEIQLNDKLIKAYANFGVWPSQPVRITKTATGFITESNQDVIVDFMIFGTRVDQESTYWMDMKIEEEVA